MKLSDQIAPFLDHAVSWELIPMREWHELARAMERAPMAAHDDAALRALEDLVFALMAISVDPSETAKDLKNALSFVFRSPLKNDAVVARARLLFDRLGTLQEYVDQ